ncbi:MAG: hypothetical protein IT306_02835 [Chloroflexi bacterium]|nr:hypothetical protein [Chloroflexota bacterium]
MSIWRTVISVLMVFMLTASAAVAQCDDEPVPASSGANEPKPMSTASAAVDTAFGAAGMARLSLDGNARFMAVAIAPDGGIFAAGFITVGGDQAMAVARLTPAGTLDSTFGTNGIASVNVSPGKTGELARSVVLQNDKILISGPIERDVSAAGDAARDTDIAVVQFDRRGQLDPSFGQGGIARIDLGTGRVTTGTTFVGDTSWGMDAMRGGRIIVFGSKLADGPDRTDTDYVVVGLTSNGALDPEFGANGMVVVDLNKSGDSPRNIIVQGDAKIVTSGYSSSGGVVRPVLIRLSANGILDPSFGDGGIATDTVLPGVTEAYNVTRHGSDYVAAGYGRGADANEKVDLVAYRFHGDGKRDLNFGIGDGVTRINIADDDDRARNILALPDGRLVAVGSGKRTASDIDGMVVLLAQNGKLIEEFGEGGKLITDIGGPNDSWYGVALTPDKSAVIVAGFMGADLSGNAGPDQAVVMRIKI